MSGVGSKVSNQKFQMLWRTSCKMEKPLRLEKGGWGKTVLKTCVSFNCDGKCFSDHIRCWYCRKHDIITCYECGASMDHPRAKRCYDCARKLDLETRRMKYIPRKTKTRKNILLNFIRENKTVSLKDCTTSCNMTYGVVRTYVYELRKKYDIRTRENKYVYLGALTCPPDSDLE